MAALQCDYASEAKRVAGRLGARRVPPAATRVLVGLAVALLLMVAVLLLELFRGHGERALSGLLEAVLVVSIVLLPLALALQRGERRRALAALGELARSAPLCSFDSPSDGFTFFTKTGCFREESLSYVDYVGDQFRATEVRYDAAARRLTLLGSEPGYRGHWAPATMEVDLPAGASAASIRATVEVLAGAVRGRSGI